MAKHEWEPTDNQGQSMECLNCGLHIGIQDTEEWNKHLNAECPKGE